MDEQKIRRIIREEIARDHNSSRYRVNAIPNHQHDGVDSLKIKADNIVPSVSVSGRIEFAQTARYTINLNSSFTPSSILAYGNVFDSATSPTVRCLSIGSANLTPSFYLQPDTATTVVTGNIQYPFPTELFDGTFAEVPLQSSTYLATGTGSPNFRASSSEGHIVSIEYGGTIHARVTVIGYSKNAIILDVPYLTSGWSIIVNYVIT